MDINFTITYEAYFDLDQAEKDFHRVCNWKPEPDIDEILYNVVEENIVWPITVDDLPNEVVETAATALRNRIGGIQMTMDLPSFPTLWQEDSVWKMN